MPLLVPVNIVEDLRFRAKLKPPATTQQVVDAEATLGVKFAPFYIDLFKCFNGFFEADERLVKLWSLQEIVDESAYACLKSGVKYFPIGDVIIYSHLILVAFENDRLPVYYTDSDEEIASDVADFLAKLAQGELGI